MKTKKLLAGILTLVLGFSVLGGCGTVGSSTKVGTTTKNKHIVLNMAIQPSMAFLPLYEAKEHGWIEEALKKTGYDVEVNWTESSSGPPMNEAFAAGQQDIGVCGDVPLVKAVADGQDNKFIAVAAEGGPAYSILVPVGSDIQSAQDLKGKTIGVTLGSTAQYLISLYLKANGMDMNTDVELISIEGGDAQSFLSQGGADAVALWEPNVSRLVESGTAEILASGDECGLLAVNCLFARTDFVESYPEIAQIVLAQYYRGAMAYEEDKESVAVELAAYFDLTPELMINAADKYAYNVVWRNEDVTALQGTADFLYETENIDREIDVSEYAYYWELAKKAVESMAEESSR